jgi:uncharacterized protein YbcC (UPF0753/DUF2309 family)
MTALKGRHLKVRAMVYVAGEPMPFFWPMRSFIHHNPLHGLEHLPFRQAVQRGEKLFHARGFLARRAYQAYLADGTIAQSDLAAEVRRFCAQRDADDGIELERWVLAVLEGRSDPVCRDDLLADSDDLYAVLSGISTTGVGSGLRELLLPRLREELLGERPVYEAIDAIYGTRIAEELDELVIRSCLDFFDEGQAVWAMPGREQGFLAAWRDVAGHRARALLDKIEAVEGNGAPLASEMVIHYLMHQLGVAEDLWVGYLTREIGHLHGWAGFIRWRTDASHYHWSERYPGDLVDLLAIRMTMAQVLLDKRAGHKLPKTVTEVEAAIDARPEEMFLRVEFNSGAVHPRLVNTVEKALARERAAEIIETCAAYVDTRRASEARALVACLRGIAERVGDADALSRLDSGQLATLVGQLRDMEREEGMLWLRALEAKAMRELLGGVSLEPPPPRDKRPFVQAAFCIDTRSERIRRHLEGVGDYQTFGIAGFFGVPVSLIELGKGSEMHLCPVLLTPKNLVLEMTAEGRGDPPALGKLETVLHKLKESVISPFVTVEAVGLLFGFDMIGKTVAPRIYNRLRKRLHERQGDSHLLLDKLSREQADSIVRAVQRAVIVEAVAYELGLQPEDVTDDVVRTLREAALGHAPLVDGSGAALQIDDDAMAGFVQELRSTYRINPKFARQQFEQLGRIGFTIEEQVSFVLQALSSIGLTEDFSRFVLLVGHGSTSENNPYESALDCGACGGNHGLFSARVLAQMANKPLVRRRLANHGIAIPDDAWFMPAYHDTTTDEVTLHDLDLLPATHLVYLDRLRTGLLAAARLCAQERLPSLQIIPDQRDPASAFNGATRNAMDWSQVRPEWGLARNAYFVVGRRSLTRGLALDGRAFLHSYDYRIDPKQRLLENILTGPLVVGQWINMEHYFSTVDNERFGSGSKVYHNVAGRFAVMTGNLSDLRTGLPAQTVLDKGRPHHEPLRLITLIEAPFAHAQSAIESVVAVKRLVRNGWIRLIIIDPETAMTHSYDAGDWITRDVAGDGNPATEVLKTR